MTVSQDHLRSPLIPGELPPFWCPGCGDIGNRLPNFGLDLSATGAAHSVVPPLCLLSVFAVQASVRRAGGSVVHAIEEAV